MLTGYRPVYAAGHPPPAGGASGAGMVPRKTKKTYYELLRTRLSVRSHRIQQLTEQARCDIQHSVDLGSSDATALVNYLFEQPLIRRDAPLFLMDSILSNIPQYRPLFQTHIRDVVLSTVQEEKPRNTVLKLLDKWRENRFFSADFFNGLQSDLQLLSQGKPVKPYRNNPPSVVSAVGVSGGPSGAVQRVRRTEPWITAIRNLVDCVAGFITDPWRFDGGLMMARITDPTHRANFTLPPSIQSIKSMREVIYTVRDNLDRNSATHMLTDVYNVVNELRVLGVITSTFDRMYEEAFNALQIATQMEEQQNALSSSSSATSASGVAGGGGGTGLGSGGSQNGMVGGGGVNDDTITPIPDSRGSNSSVNRSRTVCPFFNSADGCKDGSLCKMAHITPLEKKIQDKVEERSQGRYRLTDVVKPSANEKKCTIYSIFGGKEKWAKALKREHRRASTLLSHGLKACPNCGLRVASAALENHLNWHFEIRQRAGMAQRVRGLFLTANDWVRDVTAVSANNLVCTQQSSQKRLINENSSQSELDFDENLAEYQIERPTNYRSLSCAICGEGFDDPNKATFNPDSNVWMLTGVCYEDGSTCSTDLPLVHRKCFKILSVGRSSRSALKVDLYSLTDKLQEINEAESEEEDEQEDPDAEQGAAHMAVDDSSSESDTPLTFFQRKPYAVLVDPAVFEVTPLRKRRKLNVAVTQQPTLDSVSAVTVTDISTSALSTTTVPDFDPTQMQVGEEAPVFVKKEEPQ